MRRFIVLVLSYGGAAAVICTAIVIFALLQEVYNDDLPERAAAAGISLPLEDPIIEVSIQRGTLSLLEGDVMLKRWNIGQGRVTAGRRVNREGSTPIGEYRVVAKRMREDVLERGSRYLILDFPSDFDAQRALDLGAISYAEYLRIAAAAARDELPPTDSALGGPVCIQGNFFFFRNSRCTDGCIAMGNAEINQLYEYVPVGTPVIIEY